MRSGSATRFTALANGALTALLLAALVLFGPASTLAQEKDEYEFDDIPTEEPSPIQEAIKTELVRAAGEYWTARLNEYKVRVDKMLAPNDLAELNKLRVRWAILIDYGKQLYQKRKSAQGVKDSEVATELGLDTEAMTKMNELMEIHTAAAALAARYRSDLDPMGTTVVNDVIGFVRLMEQRLTPLASEYRTRYPNDTMSKNPVAEDGTLRDAIAGMESEQGRKDMLGIYSTAIEPVVLLYDGADLSALFGAAPSPVAATLGDLSGADMSALKQNFPNPASTRTSIAYVLAEPSSSTMLRIYNAGGDLVAQLDQGSRPAGENVVDLDVSSYPSGTYLYHLSVQTPAGPRVYAKTMKVVR